MTTPTRSGDTIRPSAGMRRLRKFQIQSQPDDATCGPTCLHAVYRYFNDSIPHARVIREVRKLDHGGTLAVLLALHALERGYHTTLYTFNLDVFDPTWFKAGIDLPGRLRKRIDFKKKQRLSIAGEAYLEYMEQGGRIRFEDLTTDLIRRHLKEGLPILTGLSATYLYRCAREFGPQSDHDDIRGDPSGHFVVLSGYDPEERTVRVADPYRKNPVNGQNYYNVNLERLVCAILMGILTYDANLLILKPDSD